MAILETRTVQWLGEASCASTAQALAAKPGTRAAFIELRGPLGAGKTTFVRYLLHALGVEGRVKSPTYAVMEPYQLPASSSATAPTSAWHFDFYRFNDPREWEDAGFRDIFASTGLKLAEWPEQAAGLLPEPDLRITITPASFSVDADAVTGPADPADDQEDAAESSTDPRHVEFSALTALGMELLP